MKKTLFILLFLIYVVPSYSQFDDLFKKIPGVGDFLSNQAITTSIKDAYPVAFWLDGIDKQIPLSESDYTPNLEPGYYKFNMKTYCLHAGTYAPTEGSGYLIAPLKGSKAGVIKDILKRSVDHPEVEQKDVQLLIWGVEAGMKFTDYQPDFQLRVAPLLTPEDIAKMQIDMNKYVNMVLPQEVQNILQLYSDMRTKIADVNSSFEDVEKLAVKVGVPPLGPGSKNVNPGSWSAAGNGYYIRSFPVSYPKSVIEVYKPENVTVSRDSQGRIISYEDASYKIQITYDDSQGSTTMNTGVKKLPIYRFKSLQFTTLSTAVTQTINDKGWSIPPKGIGIEASAYTREDDPDITTYDARKKSINDLIKKLKKYLDGLPKSRELKDKDEVAIRELESLVLGIQDAAEKGGLSSDVMPNFMNLTTSALNNYIDKISGNEKGSGGNSSTSSGGLDLAGLVAAPGNTAQQRLGTGGPGEGNGNKNPKKKEPENYDIILHQVPKNFLPSPGSSTSTYVEYNFDYIDHRPEAIRYTLYSVSRELGRCLNDKENGYYDTRLDEFFDFVMNDGFTIGPDSLTAQVDLNAFPGKNVIYIQTMDYGGFGQLKADVLIEGQWYPAHAEITGKSYIMIPYDLNENRIADIWEEQNSVVGKPETYDIKLKPSGQANDKDGLTLYENYRGFFVSDGSTGKDYVRPDPNIKTLFVIDDDQMFPKPSWEAASGMQAYWLTKDLVYGDKAGNDLKQYRWVDFCRGFASGTKYAVRLIKESTMIDPNGEWDYPVFGYNDPAFGPPINANRTYIFPLRIRTWFSSLPDSLTKWLKGSPGGLQWGSESYTAAQINKFINMLKDPKKFDFMVGFWTDLVVVHEVGHACNGEHHGGGDTTKTATGDPMCPMRYSPEVDMISSAYALGSVFQIIDKENITPILTYTKWRFCKKQDNCWKKLDVNDK